MLHRQGRSRLPRHGSTGQCMDLDREQDIQPPWGPVALAKLQCSLRHVAASYLPRETTQGALLIIQNATSVSITAEAGSAGTAPVPWSTEALSATGWCDSRLVFVSRPQTILSGHWQQHQPVCPGPPVCSVCAHTSGAAEIPSMMSPVKRMGQGRKAGKQAPYNHGEGNNRDMHQCQH